MKTGTHLDSVAFQLTPTRTRCDLIITANGKTEKIASGLLNPFLAHLKTAQDQIDKGGYSILLEPAPGSDTTWFTKGTVERFVRFVSTPEILERVHTLESEILQLEKAIAIQGNNDMGLTTVEDYQAKPVGNREGIKSTTDGNEEKAIVLYKPDAHPPEANGSTAEQGNSKVQLLKVLETRKIVLQKEQGMAFARAVAAGFDIDHMAPLLSFAECFGASRLMEACLRFMDLWNRKHETGQWLEIEAAEAMASPSEFSAMAASGIILSSVANQQNEPHGDLASETNGNPGLDASIDGRRFNDHQAQVGQQEYYQGQFPYPMFPPWPAHSPPGALPVYQPYPVQGVPYYQSYPASGPFYPPPHPHVEDSGRNTGRKGRRRRNSSVDSTDSSSESEALVMENGASQTRGSRKKDGKSGKKKSGVVVIRNLNYVASKGQNSSVSESPTASDSDTGKETMNNNSSSLKRKGNSAKPAGELNSNDKEEAIFGKESDGGHWEAFQNFLLRDSDEKGRADDQGMFGLEKKAQLKRRHNTGGHDPLAVVGRDPVEAQDGRMSELDKVSGNASRMLRPSNDEGLMSRREGHHMDDQMDVQSLGMNGRKLAYRNNANDDFMTIGRESQSHISHSADPLAVNGFTNSNINTIGTSQDMTDESFMVPFRSMSLDEVGIKERTAIDIDSELPLTGQKSENSYTRTGNQANYEPDDLSLMPERGTEKDKMGYDPALEYERQAHIRDSGSLHNRNKEAAASEAKQGSKKSRVTSDALDKKKSVGPIRKGKPSKLSPLDDARARAEKLRTYKADLQKLKKEKDEEQQKRLEALRRERQKRIAARGSSSVAPSPSSQQSKRQLPTRPSLSSHRGSKFSDSEPGSSSPLQRSKLRTVSLGSTESQKASKTSKSTNDIQLPGNRLTRSVSSLPEPRKEASGVTPDSKASMAHIRRLSEPKTSSTSNVALVKTRTPQLASKPKVSGEPENKKIVAHQLASKPKVSGEPESKKIAAIINLDKSKAATLPELKIKTPKGSLDVGQNKSAPKEMSQKVKVNKSSVASGSNNDKNPHENDVDDNPIIDKSVVMFEPEKTSVPVLSSGKSMGVQKEYHVNLENIEKAEMTPEFAAVRAPASPPDGVAIQPIHSQLQEQTRSYEVNTSNTEKEPSRSSSTHTAEKPYQAPFARLSSVEEPCTMNSEYGKFPSVALGTVKTGAETAKAQVSGFVNLKIENISEAPEKTQVKESPKGFKRLLKFGRKNQSLAAGEQSLESDKASINGTELDDNATNSASSSEVHTLKNLISQDETPTVGTTTQKSSRHFSLLSPFRSKNSEKKSTA